MTSPHCDVITGCHIEDRVKHIFVLEGLHWKGLKTIWEQIPHHHSEGIRPHTIIIFIITR